MKKIIFPLVFFFMFTGIQDTKGQESYPTIAILDTALDTSLPIFKDRISYEVCITEFASCPNGDFLMEGPGSSTLSRNALMIDGFGHGTEMASLAVATNPKIKIVFIRIIGTSIFGARQVATERTVYNALDWVILNKDRFGIDAVSMSQGHHNLLLGDNYCPKTPSTESRIDTLYKLGVPVFVATGNYSSRSKINWPACIPNAIAVGAVTAKRTIFKFSNHDNKLVDFLAIGSAKGFTAGGNYLTIEGTSAANVIAATQWATISNAKQELNYNQLYDLISRTSFPIKRNKTMVGKIINMNGAIND